ncbi:hypothetical protein [Devosia sp. 2618]|uniref:hypothetical protein n=1 Tax=Devosia sp. 2618 TaxID=3156454 RepID=UPI00339381DA
MTKTTIRMAAWLALLFIAFATLSPIGLRPRSLMPVDLERAMAFLLVGALFAAAYPRHIWWTAIALAITIFGLEWLQNLRPDRHARDADAIFKLIGAGAGLCLGWVMAKLAGLTQPSR